MKLFKLVLTGTATLMCIILVVIQTKSCVQSTVTVVQQHNSSTGEGNDSITDYPFNITVNLGY